MLQTDSTIIKNPGFDSAIRCLFQGSLHVSMLYHVLLNTRFDIGTVICPRANTTVPRTNNSDTIKSLFNVNFIIT